MRNNSKYSVNSDNDSGLSLGKEVLSSFSSNHSNTQSSLRGSKPYQSVYLKIFIVDLSKHVKYEFSIQNSVFDVKRALLKKYGQRLSDPINYGLFIPHQVNKAGKFLQDERLLSEYVTATNVMTTSTTSNAPANQNGTILRLEFIYKSRISWPDKSTIGDTEKKINSKVNHSRFIDYIIRNDPAKVKKALSKGLDPNFHCASGETPLTLTAKLSNPAEMITTLVSGGAHLDYRAVDTRTPLHKAAISGNYETVVTLLNFGASANCVDNCGITPLYYSILYDSSTKCLVKLLYEHGKMGVIDKRGLREIHQACRLGKPDHLDVLLAYGADIDSRTECHLSTPLHVAAYTGQDDCVRLLLLRGADRTLCNSQGRTALMEAKACATNQQIVDIITNFRDSEIHTKPNFKAAWNPKRRSCEFDVTSAHLKMSLGTTNHIPSSSSICNSNKSSSVDRSRRKTMGVKQHRHQQQQQQQHNYNGLPKSASSVRLKERCASQGAIAKSMSYNVFSDPDDTSAASSDLRSQTNSNREPRINYQFGDNYWRHSSMLSLDSDSATDSDSGCVREVVLQKSTHCNYGIDLDDITDNRGPSLYVIDDVEIGSPAFLAGIRCGDYLLEINGVDVRHATIQTVKQLFSQNQESVLLKVAQAAPRYSDASTDPSLHYEQFVYQQPLPRQIIRNAASVDNLATFSTTSSSGKRNQTIGESSTTLNSITTLMGAANQGAVGQTTSVSSSIDATQPIQSLTNVKDTYIYQNSEKDINPYMGNCFTLGRRNRSQSTDKRYMKNSAFKNETLLKYRSPLTPGVSNNNESLKPILKNASIVSGVKDSLSRTPIDGHNSSFNNSFNNSHYRKIPASCNYTTVTTNIAAPPQISKSKLNKSMISHSNTFDVIPLSLSHKQQQQSVYNDGIALNSTINKLKPPIHTDKEPALRKLPTSRTNINTSNSSRDSSINNVKLSTSEEDFCLPPPVSFQ